MENFNNPAEQSDSSEPIVDGIEAIQEQNEVESKVDVFTPPKQKVSKISYEKKKSMYGYGFIGLWFIGTIYFFIIPIIKSIFYSFNNTQPVTGEMELTFVGLKHYVDAFRNNAEFVKELVANLQLTALKTPLIIVFAIFVAIILNQKFKGRIFARAVFFLPVIIATGPVINIINGNMDSGGYSGGSEQFSTMFETDLVGQLLQFMGIYGISDALTKIIDNTITNIFDLVWNAGIQILIILAALQNIPPSAKEAAQMEGATAWEYFWKITLPYISPMIFAILIYTIIDAFTDPSNTVMTMITKKGSDWEYGYAAAMSWSYFAIVIIAIGIISAIATKFIYYEVE